MHDVHKNAYNNVSWRARGMGNVPWRGAGHTGVGFELPRVPHPWSGGLYEIECLVRLDDENMVGKLPRVRTSGEYLLTPCTCNAARQERLITSSV